MPNEPLILRPMEAGEETETCKLVVRIFDDLVAPVYSQEGVNEFLEYARPDAFLRRLQRNHFVLLATVQDRIVGMIEIRDNSHVSLFFVDRSFQHKGIGRELLRRALEVCQGHESELREVTVNASPNSVQIYARLGFRPTRSEQVVNGIRFTPMTLEDISHV
jgi:GNAT superfamily N-acetyltransferase